MTEIRTFEPEDTFSVIKLASQTLTEKYNPSLFAYFYETNPDGFIVANLNHKIIGFLIGVKINNQKTKILMISVSPQHQKQKIGTKLLEEFIKRTQKEEINTIELEVRIDNHKAIQFYEKYGFRKIIKIKEFYQDNKDAYTMQLRF
ncbi:MAG: ribosomal protein S18-alanine N-acetyltransferase [Candidatus Thermoplasmatota archaeon]|nr:ribosomal protein S18-alanine N-acetyltransferase [Candidatus Thermoplasmatota archaeon]